MSKPLYVFDMDETLISADCSMIWNEFLVEKGIATAVDFIEEDKRLMGLYSEGKLDMEDYLSFSMQPLINMPTDQVSTLVKECVGSHILPKQFTQSKPLIDKLHRDGVDMIVISATASFIVGEVSNRLGIKHYLGIDIEEEEGCYTDKVRGVPTYREGKIIRLEQWLKAQSESFSEIHFYTDSINDLPLCEYADFAYLVNPCSRLKEHSDKPNWTVLHWD